MWQKSSRRQPIAFLILIILMPVHSTPVQALTLFHAHESVTPVESTSAGAPSITEIMYNPPDDGEIQGMNLEFIELHNSSDEAVDLSDARFSAGIEYTFAADAQLPGHAYLVLARSSVDFHSKYGFGPYDQYSGQLNNAGERITLNASDGATLFTVRYNEKPPWPSSPNGSGFSLVLRDPSNEAVNLDDGSNWRASAAEGGSPGIADGPSGPDTAAILVNEVLPHTDLPDVDSIELYNPTDEAVDIGGWFLSDDSTPSGKFRIPDGTVIEPGQYQVFEKCQENDAEDCAEDEFDFGFSSFGDEAYIFAADALGNLTGYRHGFAFGTSDNGVSFGRYVTSTEAEHFPAQSEISLGAANVGPKVGPLVISEIMYHPPVGGDEYVKVTNIGDKIIQLYDAEHPDNTWRFNGIGNYVLPKGMILSPGSDLLIVPTAPDRFRAKYAIPAKIQITGPYTGTLSNNGELIQLLKPDHQDIDGTVPYFVVDEVDYNDALPWPVEADGQGSSLRRIDQAAYGNDPANWRASTSFRFFLPHIASNTP